MNDILLSMKKWFLDNQEQIYKDLFSFLSFPSIATDSKYKKDVFNCAKWVENYLSSAGLKTQQLQTSSFPVVFGETKDHESNAKTLLIYGHYDVQPIDPIEEWESDPFIPMIKDNQIYARGAVDDKGQIFYVMVALKYFIAHREKYPVHIKVCIEGEEESSSKGLSEALPSLKEIIKADYILAVDAGIPSLDRPAINLGARGVCQLSLKVNGSKSDLHSGEFGGIAYNPLHALVEVLSTLWDKKGRVTLKHFYDDVDKITKEEKEQFIKETEKDVYEKEFGIYSFFREKGFSLDESSVLRPILEINGIGGGYFQEGFKTVIPREAVAKISCRLVPHQDPNKIIEELAEYLKKNIHEGMKVEIEIGGSGKALRCDSHSTLVEITSQAYSEVFAKPCEKILMGGSIPILSEMVECLEGQLVVIGLGLGNDNIHAPNEHFGKDRFEKGFLIISRILEILNKEG